MRFVVILKITLLHWSTEPDSWSLRSMLHTKRVINCSNGTVDQGVACASITRLEKKITEAEAMKDESGIADRVCTLKEKVDTAYTEFKKHHVSIVELLDEEYVEAEQGVLDSHEDEVLNLLIHLE